MNLDDARDMFIAESRDCLHVIEQQLLAMEQQLAGNESSTDDEALNQLFRAAHTIKGSAGLFALDAIVEFTHIVENVLDALRRSRLVADRALITLLLNAKDYIGALLDTLTGGAMPALDDTGRAMMAALGRHLAPSGTVASVDAKPVVAEPAAVAAAVAVDVVAANVATVANPYWHLSLRFYADVLRDGMDPLSFLHYLSRHGTIKCVRILTDDLPACDDFDAELLYVGFEIDLESMADADTIASTFEFVREQSLIEILPPNAALEQYRRLVWILPEPESRLQQLWVDEMRSLTAQEWGDLQALALVSAPTSPPAPVSESIANAGTLATADADNAKSQREPAPAVAAQSRAGNRPREARFIKIDAGKLDQLINLVGELVTSTAATQLQAQRLADSANSEAVATVMELVEQVRDNALSLRMVAMSEVFNRFPRVVRDVAQELGKEIELKIDGADTELDKSLVEKLTDPLTHIVRNAIDHGIESMDVRIAAGKPRHGTVWLSARHDAGGIVIEVRDDGGGLKRDRILAKAIEKQLISADAQLSDSEVWQLLFLPGFSTAEAVTNLSGRGVGMDVVKRNIESQHGSVEFDSVAGQGTQLRIRLPLTLAIIDGFQFSVFQHRFVVPLDAVIECFELSALTQDERGANCVNLRGEVLPLIRIARVYELTGDDASVGVAQRQNIVVVQAGQRRAGLVVDTLQGELQAVIKPLSRLFRGLRGVGGSTVLGSGDVALILDVAQLIGLAQSVSQRAFVSQH